MQDWEGEGGCFARAGLGDSDDVFGGEARGDGLELDFCGRVEAEGLAGGAECGFEAQICEGGVVGGGRGGWEHGVAVGEGNDEGRGSRRVDCIVGLLYSWIIF